MDYLVQQAAVYNFSISDVIRKLIDKKMAKTIATQSFSGMQMAQSAAESPTGFSDHGEVLYR